MMVNLEILNYIYGVDEFTGKLKKFKVEEVSYMRNYTLAFVEDVGLVTFHGGKPSEKNGMMFFLTANYIIQYYHSHNAKFSKRIESLDSSRSYHYNEWQNCIKRIKELKEMIPSKEHLIELSKEDKEKISKYLEDKARGIDQKI